MSSSIRFIHIRQPNSQKGGKTFAYVATKDLVEFAMAECSSRDNYCRKTGRAIATGRLNAGKSLTIKCDGTKPIDAILQEIGYVNSNESACCIANRGYL